MKINPFHSKNQTNVYHTNDKCGAGAEIPGYDRLRGTGDNRLCKNCKKLNSR
jgi:hypothetical protein